MMKRSDTYLGSSVLRATADTMAVASSVLGFDLVELWTSEDSSETLFCTYVHGTDEIIKAFPNLITGHYPQHKREHKLSPQLCRLAKLSPNRYHWRVVSEDEEADFHGGKDHSPLHPDLFAPMKTQMAFWVDGQTAGCEVYIVGFSLSRLNFTTAKLRFLNGVGYAIYVAAFDLEDETEQDQEQQAQRNATELDIKEFLPRPIAAVSSVADLSSISDPNLLVWTGKESSLGGQPPMLTSTSSPIILGLAGDTRKPSGSIEDNYQGSEHSQVSEGFVTLPPSWDPVDSYNFPVIELPTVSRCRNDLSFDDFKDLLHIADGSNSNIYLGVYHNERVIIKMIKESAENDTVAMHEFDVEHGMLCRFNHPNIIKLLGAGRNPRRFIVLEWLGGGSLNTLLQEHQVTPGFAKRLFRKPSFTYANLLTRARDIASALNYLHSQVHPLATIIHRDLKPDNIGFTKDGAIKLMDFGLCTVVKRRRFADEVYDMTGNTGSLRYMAPEVALRKPYSEKTDVYSFGIMVWQMARDQVPFKGMNRAEFIQRVAVKGERPKADKSWPTQFTQLLESCWHADQEQRPGFDMIVKYLDSLIYNQGLKFWKLTKSSSIVSDSGKSVTNDENSDDSSRPGSGMGSAMGSRIDAPTPPPRERRGKEDSRSSWF